MSGRVACGLALAVVAALAGPRPAAADSVTLRGSTISITGCTVRSIRAGRVMFRDARGRRHERRVEDVALLAFDGLPELDEAETRIADRDYEQAVRWLRRALRRADTEPRRLWTHARLSRVHDLRGEYVLAARHAASVFTLDDDATWLVLEPMSPPDAPPYPALAESLAALETADRRVRSTQLARIVDRLLREVRPRHDRAAAGWNGPPVDPDATISGVPRAAIDADTVAAMPDDPPADPRPAAPVPAPVEGRPVADPAPPAAPPARAERGPDRDDGLAALLADERFEEAVAACRRLETRFDGRSVPRFLEQYGQALLGAGRPRDAAVMFMRCALAHPQTVEGQRSLVATARIHLDVLDDRAAARRLLARAESAARRAGRTDLAAEAGGLLDEIGDG